MPRPCFPGEKHPLSSKTLGLTRERGEARRGKWKGAAGSTAACRELPPARGKGPGPAAVPRPAGKGRSHSSLIICNAHAEAISGERLENLQNRRGRRVHSCSRSPRAAIPPAPINCRCWGIASTCPRTSIAFRSCLPVPQPLPSSHTSGKSIGEKKKQTTFRDKSLLVVRIPFPGDSRHLVPIAQAPTCAV